MAAAARAGVALLALLLPLAAAAAPPPAAAAELAAEAAIMQRLRQSVHDADPEIARRLPQWRPGDATPHCRWPHVICDAGGHVTQLFLWRQGQQSGRQLGLEEAAAAPPPSAAARALQGPLLPQLAQLKRLQMLDVVPWSGDAGRPAVPLAGIPPEWGAPGAFPRLQT